MNQCGGTGQGYSSDGRTGTEDYFGRDGEGAFYLVVLASHTFVRIGQDCQ